jgi:formamidase
MGKEGIRYAAKVELDKDAGTLPYLHVRFQPDLDGHQRS